jgi:hypothetical protein
VATVGLSLLSSSADNPNDGLLVPGDGDSCVPNNLPAQTVKTTNIKNHNMALHLKSVHIFCDPNE